MAHEPFIEPFFTGNSQLWRTIEYCRLEYVVKERDFVDFFTKFSDCRAISLPFLAATAFWKCSSEDNFQSMSSNIENIIHFYAKLT